MFKELQIKNFKGWQDTGRIRMAPLTLFFGVNSSGKSSIGQFLMMLKQTAESQDRKMVFYPGGKNSAVQLGSYLDMVHGRKAENVIEFNYSWTLKDDLQVKDPISEKMYGGNAMKFKAGVGLDKGDSSLVLNQFDYGLCDNDQVQLSVGMENNPEKGSEYKVESPNYKLKRKQQRVWKPGPPVRFYGFPDEVVAYYQNADFVQLLNLEHEKLFHSVYYLGPLRTKAERLYSWTGIEPESVGYSGDNTVAAILAARTGKRKLGLVKFGNKKASGNQSLETVIAQKLLEMGLIEDFKVNAISEKRQEYEVKVRTGKCPDYVDLPDVGFGISQVLPVLVECFYAPAGSIIIMEQPEIHLHPRAQAALADVMIDAIRAKENGKDRNIQLIIETHSEHFLRRLQRRIAEDVISQEMVSAYFADVSQYPARLNGLDIDLFGNISNWPENFFGDEMEDVVEQSKAALAKRNKQIGNLKGRKNEL